MANQTIGNPNRPVFIDESGVPKPCERDILEVTVTNHGNNDVLATFNINGDLFDIKNIGADSSAFVVTFVDWDGTELKKQAVLKGHDATAPEHPARPNYTSNGWDKDFTNVQMNLIVTALYVPVAKFVTAHASGGPRSSPGGIAQEQKYTENGGDNWKTSTGNYLGMSVAYSGGVFVKAIWDSSNSVSSVYSTDDGKTWSPSTTKISGQLFVCGGKYGGAARFVMAARSENYGVGEPGWKGKWVYSTDKGKTWKDSNQTGWCNQQFGVAYSHCSAGDIFVVGDYCNGYDIWRSTNGGQTWTQVVEDGAKITCMSAVRNQFIHGSSDSYNYVSDDGETWSRANFGAKGSAIGFAGNESITVAVCENYIYYTKSLDLKNATWKKCSVSPNSPLTSVAYCQGIFIATSKKSGYGSPVYISNDGKTWRKGPNIKHANWIAGKTEP